MINDLPQKQIFYDFQPQRNIDKMWLTKKKPSNNNSLSASCPLPVKGKNLLFHVIYATNRAPS